MRYRINKVDICLYICVNIFIHCVDNKLSKKIVNCFFFVNQKGVPNCSKQRRSQAFQEGRQAMILPNFAENCMKMKTIGPRFYYVDPLVMDLRFINLIFSLRFWLSPRLTFLSRGLILVFFCIS